MVVVIVGIVIEIIGNEKKKKLIQKITEKNRENCPKKDYNLSKNLT